MPGMCRFSDSVMSVLPVLVKVWVHNAVAASCELTSTPGVIPSQLVAPTPPLPDLSACADAKPWSICGERPEKFELWSVRCRRPTLVGASACPRSTTSPSLNTLPPGSRFSSTDTENVAGATNRPAGGGSAQTVAARVASKTAAALSSDARERLECARSLTVVVAMVGLLKRVLDCSDADRNPRPYSLKRLNRLGTDTISGRGHGWENGPTFFRRSVMVGDHGPRQSGLAQVVTGTAAPLVCRQGHLPASAGARKPSGSVAPAGIPLVANHRPMVSSNTKIGPP